MIDKEKMKETVLNFVQAFIGWAWIGYYAWNMVRLCNKLTEDLKGE